MGRSSTNGTAPGRATATPERLTVEQHAALTALLSGQPMAIGSGNPDRVRRDRRLAECIQAHDDWITQPTHRLPGRWEHGNDAWDSRSTGATGGATFDTQRDHRRRDGMGFPGVARASRHSVTTMERCPWGSPSSAAGSAP